VDDRGSVVEGDSVYFGCIDPQVMTTFVKLLHWTIFIISCDKTKDISHYRLLFGFFLLYPNGFLENWSTAQPSYEVKTAVEGDK
jgi:hypothetical protein